MIECHNKVYKNARKYIKMALSVDKSETISGPVDDLRAFCRVVELGSISAAARMQGETKGSISRRVSRLELQLGIQLLARHPRSVVPTTEGMQFFSKVRAGLLLLEEGAELARESKNEPRGQLRITAPIDLAQEWLSPLLVEFQSLHPRLTIELLSADERLDLVAHQIDVAMRATGAGGLPDMGYSARRLTDLRFGFFATPAYLAKAGVPRAPEALLEQALILRTSMHHKLSLFCDDPEQAPVTLMLTPRFSSNSFATVLRLTLAGAGIGFMPSLIAQAARQRGELMPVLADWQGERSDLFMITLGGQRAPAKVVAFKQFIQEKIGS
jgi:DNA-binding transcriptional LysR family regulator